MDKKNSTHAIDPVVILLRVFIIFGIAALVVLAWNDGRGFLNTLTAFAAGIGFSNLVIWLELRAAAKKSTPKP